MVVIELNPGVPFAVSIPDGWHRVPSGAVQIGDMHLDRVKALAGETEWVRLGFEHFVENVGDTETDMDFYDGVEWFCCIIRKDGEPYPPPRDSDWPLDDDAP